MTYRELRVLRIDLDISQCVVGKRLGKSQAAISMYETGERPISEYLAKRWESVLRRFESRRARVTN